MKTRFRLLIASALCIPGLTFCNSGTPSPALGETLTGSVRRVSSSMATGASGTQPPLIELSPGYGVNISFIPTGEVVEKVWFDNPSFATLDVDGCLSGLGGTEGFCEQNGATVLHLRRINQLNIPGLPKTNSTLLTVITSGSAGRRVYLFRVAMGSGTPKYHTVEVTPALTPPSTASNGTGHSSSIVQAASNWQTFQRGLTVAEQKRLIRRNQPLWNRIENFLTRVKAGEPIESAASMAGISLDLVRRLGELGRTDLPAPAMSQPI